METLGKFARKYHITYPILSDPHSKVIGEFGIMNTNVPAGHAWYGVPFPGTFMVDESGVVIAKSFYADHAVRDSAGSMLREGLQVDACESRNTDRVEADPVTIEASFPSKTIRPDQVQTLSVEIKIREGYHIYGTPLPEGYIPTALSFEPMHGLVYGNTEYPEPVPHYLKVLDETLNVYEGTITLKTPVKATDVRTYDITARLTYQACDATGCLLPQEVVIRLHLDGLDNVWGDLE